MRVYSETRATTYNLLEAVECLAAKPKRPVMLLQNLPVDGTPLSKKDVGSFIFYHVGVHASISYERKSYTDEASKDTVTHIFVLRPTGFFTAWFRSIFHRLFYGPPECLVTPAKEENHA